MGTYSQSIRYGLVLTKNRPKKKAKALGKKLLGRGP